MKLLSSVGLTFVSLSLLVAGGCGSRKATPGANDGGGGTGATPDASTAEAIPDAETAEAIPDAGTAEATPEAGVPRLETLVEQGKPTIATAPRPAFGAVLIANDGERIYAVESRRDVEPGPFGLPWRSRFRLAAYDAGVEAWAFAAQPDDVISDVVVHPSGDVTVAVLRQAPARMAYDLVRFGKDGAPRGTTTLSEPTTVPAGDHGASDPLPFFRMKSDLADATVGGWVRLLPEGEGLVVVFLSYVDAPPTDPLSARIALGLASLRWQTGAYAESWARVVEGPHRATPVAWTYDELRQDEQAIRPFLARDESNGDVLVGRAWNSTRCAANVAVFAELSKADCLSGSVSPVENELLPLAVTRFDSKGARLGTRVIAPDGDAGEQIPYALAARGGQLAVAGMLVRTLPGGEKRTYPDGSGSVDVDYDGYVALYDGEGKPLRHRDFNLGRGDLLAAMRWTGDGIVAVGSAGWDRWQGGNSISRGASPLVAWLSPDGTRSVTRVVSMSDGTRHFNLHDVVVLDRSAGPAILAQGFSDAPMTHSADGGNEAARTFGPLRLRLDLP